MAVWEILLAALGGLVLGFGLGIFAGARRSRSVSKRVRHMKARMRGSVIPILEGRAQALGLPRAQRGYATEDPLQAAVDLSTSIIQHQEAQNLGFSDTVDLLRADLDPK